MNENSPTNSSFQPLTKSNSGVKKKKAGDENYTAQQNEHVYKLEVLKNSLLAEPDLWRESTKNCEKRYLSLLHK